MRTSPRRGLFLALALVALVAPSALAQTRTGTLEGSIVDGTGQVLPGVSVTLTGDTGAGSEVAVSTATGSYRFLAVSPGTVLC